MFVLETTFFELFTVFIYVKNTQKVKYVIT